MIRPSFPLARVVCLFFALSSWPTAATVHTLSYMAGNGTTDDSVGLKNAVNAAGSGGTVMIMVPISAIATEGMAPGRESGAASALFNMMRNIGGSVGIALLSTLVSVRGQFHSFRIGESVSLLFICHARATGSDYELLERPERRCFL